MLSAVARSAMAAACGDRPSFIGLRVKLLRGFDGIDLATMGAPLISSLTGRAASDGLLKIGDCAHLSNSELEQLQAKRCEVTFLRQDAALVDALVEHGALEKPSESEKHIRCFRVLKAPVRCEEDGGESGRVGIETSGLRVAAVSGMAVADNMIREGDVIVALDGKRVDAASITSSLSKPTSAPMRVFTVVRACPEHDVSVDALSDAVKALWTPAATVEVAATAEVAAVAPAPTSPANASAMAPAEKAAISSRAVVEEPPASTPASTPCVRGPSRRLQNARASVAPVALAPFDADRGVWSDVPPGVDTAQPAHYDPSAGLWSDVPGQSAAPASAAMPRGSCGSTRAALDCMVRQALAGHDDGLLRRLVTAQHACDAAGPVQNAHRLRGREPRVLRGHAPQARG